MPVTSELPTTCRHCDAAQLYATDVSAGGGYAPNYLPQLGSLWGSAKFHVVVCERCGFTQFFAPQDVLSKLAHSIKWRKL